MRNIVLITLDALRADHCGYMGYERDTTPTMDRMAEEGLAFERAVAPGTNTPSSMSGIFTGEHSQQDVSFAPAEEWRRELGQRRTIADRLSSMGYATGAVHPQVHASRHFGFDSGFDHFEDFLPDHGERSVYSWILERVFGGDDRFGTLRNLRSLLFREEALKPWEAYYDRMLDWIRSAEEPFFFWTLLPDTHFPYLPPASHRRWSSRLDMYRANYACYSLIGETGVDIPPETRQRMIDIYDDAIRYSDAFIERLWEDLAEFDPVFIIHADHGEAFGKHGFYGHLPHPYEEVTHVPLVVANAGRPKRVGRPFSLLELPSLIQQLAETGEDKISDDASKWVTTKIVRDGDPVSALRFGSWKYIRDDGAELYHLDEDPREQTDVTTSHRTLGNVFEDIVQQRQQTDRERQLIRDVLTAEDEAEL